ncbi:hypothetical protein, partial [Pseudomonas sp. MPR-AND1A]|uniref:hypothetical protein n=1 Tax=Pseudomonas sp. MPR-AND1A TaxID=2070600 RepID=UPI000CB77D08
KAASLSAQGVPQPFAGSLGGAGAGGAVTVNVNADVTATGQGATAVSVTSQGGSGAAPINLTIGNVQVVGGSGGHAVTLIG